MRFPAGQLAWFALQCSIFATSVAWLSAGERSHGFRKKEAETRLEADGLPTLAKRRHEPLASSYTNWQRAGLRTKSGRSSLPANEAQNHRPARNTANYQP